MLAEICQIRKKTRQRVGNRIPQISRNRVPPTTPELSGTCHRRMPTIPMAQGVQGDVQVAGNVLVSLSFVSCPIGKPVHLPKGALSGRPGTDASCALVNSGGKPLWTLRKPESDFRNARKNPSQIPRYTQRPPHGGLSCQISTLSEWPLALFGRVLSSLSNKKAHEPLPRCRGSSLLWARWTCS